MDKHHALLELEKELKRLHQTPLGRRAFLASLPILLSACASPKKTRYREGDNSGQETSITVQDEINMTQEVMPQMRKDYPPHRDSAAQKYVQDIGQKIVKKNNLDKNPYQYNFTVVDVDQVNAFALPAGTVFVTAPLILMADSEAELAGVIGHEIGHIQARHTAERIHKAKTEQKKTALYGIGGGILGGILGLGAGKVLCNKQDRECLQRAAKYGAIAGVGGGLLIQKYAFMAHSREDEMEADRIGFRTSVAAGYDKNHVGKFYEKLLMMEKNHQGKANPLMQKVADALSTHPPGPERVKQMQSLVASETRGSGLVSSQDFNLIKKRLSKS
jgi:beta-barrel assembly-enhancing protease